MTLDEIQVQRFWGSGNNKEKIQSLSRDFFVELSMRNNIKHTIASNFTSNHHGDIAYIEFIQDATNILLWQT